MATSYPAAIDSYRPKIEGVDARTVRLQELQESLVAVQAALGTTPQGAYATVAAALATLDQLAQVVSRTNDEASSLSIGTPVYVFDSDGVKMARADAIGTARVLGLVRDDTIAAAATGKIQTGGVLKATPTRWDAVTGGSGGLTTGSVYFLDPTTAGKLTTTAPSAAGQFVVQVGLALNSTDMQISIMPPIKRN
jgi:hypothetical protein